MIARSDAAGKLSEREEARYNRSVYTLLVVDVRDGLVGIFLFKSTFNHGAI